MDHPMGYKNRKNIITKNNFETSMDIINPIDKNSIITHINYIRDYWQEKGKHTDIKCVKMGEKYNYKYKTLIDDWFEYSEKYSVDNPSTYKFMEKLRHENPTEFKEKSNMYDNVSKISKNDHDDLISLQNRLNYNLMMVDGPFKKIKVINGFEDIPRNYNKIKQTMILAECVQKKHEKLIPFCEICGDTDDLYHIEGGVIISCGDCFTIQSGENPQKYTTKNIKDSLKTILKIETVLLPPNDFQYICNILKDYIASTSNKKGRGKQKGQTTFMKGNTSITIKNRARQLNDKVKPLLLKQNGIKVYERVFSMGVIDDGFIKITITNGGIRRDIACVSNL
jgi:hypothetical protein